MTESEALDMARGHGERQYMFTIFKAVPRVRWLQPWATGVVVHGR